MKGNLNRKGFPIKGKEIDGLENDEERTTQRRSVRKYKPNYCEFCGTTEPDYNVKERVYAGKSYMLCDNPVCNYVPGNRKGDK